jgi:hypothetical protein
MTYSSSSKLSVNISTSSASVGIMSWIAAYLPAAIESAVMTTAMTPAAAADRPRSRLP